MPLPTSTELDLRVTKPRSVRRVPLHRPWAVGLVLCVLVLGMLAPAVSRALAWTRAGQAIEICTATGGAQWVIPSSTTTAPGADTGQAPLPSLDHCPFCLQATDRGAAPPPPLPYLFWAQGGNQERPVWQAFFFPVSTPLAASARGPPEQG